jgi:O-antigen/teichoic acid export membrane protein
MTASSRVPFRVWIGTAWQGASRLVASAATFVALALLARHLSAAEFGRYTFYIGVFALLDALTDFGTGNLAVQWTAGDGAPLAPTLALARRVRLAAGALGVALVLATAAVAGEPGWPWIAAAALYPLTHALELSAVVWRREIAWGRPSAVRAGAALARLALIAALAVTDVRSAAVFVFATALGSSLANVALHALARGELARARRTSAAFDARAFLALWPLGLASLCQQGYFYVDNLYVRAISGQEALGLYNSGVRLMSFLIMVSQHVSLAALPWLAARAGDAEPGALGRAAARLALPLASIAALGAGFLWPLAGETLARVYGEPFAAAAASFRWLLLATVCIYAGAPLLTAVVALGDSRAVLGIAAAGLVLNAAANAVAVPLAGIEGAGAVTFATELLVLALSAAALARAGAWRAGAASPAMPWNGAKRLALATPPACFAAGWWLGTLAAARA